MPFQYCAAIALAILAPVIAIAEPHDNIRLVFEDFQRLCADKDVYQADPSNDAYQSLLKKADRLLQLPPLSVTQKTTTPPSGDKRDYLSLAPYWWPDPEKEDGLPYIRKDGRVNPTTRGDYVDYPRKEVLFDRVMRLGMAAFHSGDPKYASAADLLLKTWFVDPETRMNPNLEYAQGVPGRNHGRCFGIIEWCGIDDIITPIQLLESEGMLSEATSAGVKEWFIAYVDWLLHSELGVQERDTLNNHGTWYDVQVVGILLYLERDDEAREILEEAKTKRIAAQIEPDGRQPHELARTKSLSYSKMNLNAFKRLAALGDKIGVDLRNFETKDGRSIEKAADFLAPFLRGEKKWEYQQITKVK